MWVSTQDEIDHKLINTKPHVAAVHSVGFNQRLLSVSGFQTFQSLLKVSK